MSKTTDKATDKATDIFQSARENEYVNRFVQDQELRNNVIEAIQSARAAYSRISDSKKGPVDAVTNDKKVKRDLHTAADSLRDASEQIRSPRKRRKGRFGKVVLLGLGAVGVTLAVSEDARNKVLDLLFGPEEEFEYTSTTSANGDAS
ncbi:MAG TPA: hypothetical protein VFD37_05555 [Solirubrobacterales bacterium]|nr:hypothetical protein [Solirubrobacterales bacterium]